MSEIHPSKVASIPPLPAWTCPKKIPIGSIMTLIRYRQKHSLLSESEVQWKKSTEKAKICDECGLCEEKCPYNLSIIPVIQEASVT